MQNSLKGVISLAQKINPEIGTYQEHYIKTGVDFAVTLTNGEIIIPFDVAYTFQKHQDILTSEQIETVVKSFRKT